MCVLQPKQCYGGMDDVVVPSPTRLMSHSLNPTQDLRWQAQLDLVVQQLHQLASRSASREDLEAIKSSLAQRLEAAAGAADMNTDAHGSRHQRVEELSEALSAASERLTDLDGQVSALQAWRADQRAAEKLHVAALEVASSLEGSFGAAGVGGAGAGGGLWSGAGTPTAGGPGTPHGRSPFEPTASFVQRQEFQVRFGGGLMYGMGFQSFRSTPLHSNALPICPTCPLMPVLPGLRIQCSGSKSVLEKLLQKRQLPRR